MQKPWKKPKKMATDRLPAIVHVSGRYVVISIQQQTSNRVTLAPIVFQEVTMVEKEEESAPRIHECLVADHDLAISHVTSCWLALGWEAPIVA